MKPIKLIFFLIATGLSVLVPFYFDSILVFLVTSIGFGWVFSTFFIRVIVIILFIIALKNLFGAFKRTSKLKTWIIALIAAVPGFFISFAIYPIYKVDYGLFNDQVTLSNLDQLSEDTGNTYKFENEYNVVAFLTVHCGFCEAACHKFNLNMEAGQQAKVDLVFSNNQEAVDDFIERNKCENFDYHIIPEDPKFLTYSGYAFPSIFVLNPDGETLYHWTGDEMNFSALDYLLSLEQ